MYRIVSIKSEISVHPTKFGMSLKKAIKESIAEKYEGNTDKRIGIGLGVQNISEIGEGKIRPEDPSVHYNVTFDLLTFKPEIHEIVIGDVIDNTEFGSFIRLGPMDGLVHVSQLLNDYVSYDEKNSIFTGKESKKILKEGDVVRTKIISVSAMVGKENKVGLTMRQPNLGALGWIERDKKKILKPKK